MINASTFLLVISCLFSIVAIIIAERARNAVIPKNLWSKLGAVEVAVATLDGKLQTHVKQEASGKAVAAKKASTGNGGEVPYGNYAALEAQLLGKPERR